MKDYYCVEIEFPGINFDSYFPRGEHAKNIHHAHLYSDVDEIELRIFYDEKTWLGDKVLAWSSKINWNKFGEYFKLSKEDQNERLQRIDLSDSVLLGISNSGSYFESNSRFIKIKIDSAKFYWNPVKGELNTGEFYLDDAGFKIVKEFYGPMFGFGGKFEISRMDGMENFYPIAKSEFRPEYNFCYSDSKDRNEASIAKEPKFQFKYNSNVSEEEAILYGDVLCVLASFFVHSQINFPLRRIHLLNNTITIKKVKQKKILINNNGLWAFNNYYDFHKLLLQDHWQSNIILNFKKISKVIQLFNQAILAEGSSEFLIRYNIIEICNDEKKLNEKFTHVLNKKQISSKHNEALQILLQTISSEDAKDFTKKWKSMSGNLSYKPMKSPLLSFFERQRLNPAEFPISVNEIKDMRDSITHGSIDKINPEQIRKVNTLLYRINGILILNLLGIDEWKLNTELK